MPCQIWWGKVWWRGGLSTCSIGVAYSQGGSQSIHEGGGGGGGDGASYCKPKKIHQSEILDPKKIPGININSFSGTHAHFFKT